VEDGIDEDSHGFVGFRVLASFEGSDAADIVPRLASTVLTTGNAFVLSRPQSFA